MKKTIKYSFVFLTAMTFWGAGVFWPSGLNFTDSNVFAQTNGRNSDQFRVSRDGQGSNGNGDRSQNFRNGRENNRNLDRRDRRNGDRRDRKRRWCRRHPDRCKPPTVSELPAYYMVGSGMAAILVTSGFVYRLRRRNEDTPTA